MYTTYFGNSFEGSPVKIITDDNSEYSGQMVYCREVFCSGGASEGVAILGLIEETDKTTISEYPLKNVAVITRSISEKKTKDYQEYSPMIDGKNVLVETNIGVLEGILLGKHVINLGNGECGEPLIGLKKNRDISEINLRSIKKIKLNEPHFLEFY